MALRKSKDDILGFCEKLARETVESADAEFLAELKAAFAEEDNNKKP